MKITSLRILLVYLPILLASFSACAPSAASQTNAKRPEITSLQLSTPDMSADILDKITQANRPNGLSYDETGIYRLYGSQLVFVPADGSAHVEMQLDMPMDISVEKGIAMADGKLYVVMNHFNIDGAYNGSWKKLLTLDTSGNVLDSVELPDLGNDNLRLDNLVVIDDTAFFLASRMWNGGGVYAYDMKTTVMTRLDYEQVDSITAMDGKLLICAQIADGFTSSLHIYDPLTERTEAEHVLNASGVTSLAYEPQTRTVYGLYNGDSLFAYTPEDKRFTALYMFAQDNAFGLDRMTGIAVYNETIAATRSSGDLEIIKNLHGDWESRDTLTVYCRTRYSASPYALAKAYAAFTKENPLFHLEFVEVSDVELYYANIAKKLMANDADFDLFEVDGNMSDIIGKSYYVDLSAYEPIVRNYEQMLPGIKSLFTSDGQLFGIPAWFIMINSYTYDSTVFAHYGIKQPTTFMTAKEYLSLFANASEDITSGKVSIGDLQFLDVYQSLSAAFFGGQDIQQNEIATFLQTMADIYHAGGLMDLTSNWEGLLKSQNFNDYTMRGNVMVAPAYAENADFAVFCTALCVNPNTANADLAADFLSVLSSPEIETAYLDENVMQQEYYNDLMGNEEAYHSHSEHADEDNDHVEEYASESSNYAEEQLSYSYLYERESMQDNAMYGLYKEYLSQSIRRYYNADLSSFAWDTFMKLVNDEVTVDKAADLLYRKMKMVRDE